MSENIRMLPENNAHPVEDFLPPADANLTLKSLLDGYGSYWMSQPSLSPYKHYYSASDKEIIVWEGYPGSYDSYGDFADDDAFYNHVVKAYQIFWHVRQNADGSVRVWGTGDTTYPSLSELRQAMLTHWTTIKPSLGEQGKTWHQFAAQHRQAVADILHEFGLAWTNEKAEARHYRVYALDTYVYLARWIGEYTALEFPAEYEPELQGHPRLNRTQVKQYSMLRVAFRRLPVRFSLEQTHDDSFRIHFSYVNTASALKTLDELRQKLTEQLPYIQLIQPAEKQPEMPNWMRRLLQEDVSDVDHLKNILAEREREESNADDPRSDKEDD